jgi:precorrin-2 dehydrogenase/sirohydrochlorin ferrochelatase
MVSTSGRGPRIAALIRQRIESSLPPNVETAILRVGQLRSRLRLMAPGTGGELGQRRMKWMIGVCDNWSLDELSGMSEEMMEQVLKGWESGEVKGYNEVGAAGGCPWYRMEKVVGPVVTSVGPWVGGFALGVIVSLGLAKRFRLGSS